AFPTLSDLSDPISSVPFGCFPVPRFRLGPSGFPDFIRSISAERIGFVIRIRNRGGSAETEFRTGARYILPVILGHVLSEATV
ncbi:hypothetical protein ACGFMM_34730, partial [Streptomyces sp. NPDC048604]|uniref:hypothetical protein n=1 Tax=Streptomyces sp. NPDC048604 TaxID=3365578 RepID=UPI00371F0F36